MSDDELKRVQAVADALSGAYQNGVNEGIEFGKTERERLRAELAAERERADKAEAQFDRLAERHREAMVTCGAEMDDAKRLRAELAAVKADCEHGYALADARLAERDALRAQLDEACEALEEAETVMSWMLLEGVDEVIHETCPKEYERFVFAHARVAALVEKIKGGGDE